MTSEKRIPAVETVDLNLISDTIRVLTRITAPLGSHGAAGGMQPVYRATLDE